MYLQVQSQRLLRYDPSMVRYKVTLGIIIIILVKP